MSARVVADLGERMVETPGGGLVLAYVLLLSCGCRAEVDRRVLLLMDRKEALEEGARELEQTHECQPNSLPSPPRSLPP